MTAVRTDENPSAPAPENRAPLLEISGLTVSYGRRATALRRAGSTRVLSGVDLTVRAGEILGIIGETGSGKTTLARATVGLVRPDAGEIGFEGRDVTRLSRRDLRGFRRTGRVQYMFQDPLRSQDPELTVRQVVAEPLASVGAATRQERARRADEALTLVGLDAGALGPRTPAQLSGGQRQRVSLARAIVTRPRLLLSDEPVSALDASNRNLVLSLLDRLRRELDLAVVVISHDLSSLAGIADRVAVLYRGRLVEQGPISEVLEHPRHPYTALLTASAPSVRREHRLLPAQLRPDPVLAAGRTPWPDDEGCVFAPRCRFAGPACREEPAAVPVPVPIPVPASGTAAPTPVETAARTAPETAARATARPTATRLPSPAGGPDPSRPHHTVACHHAATWRGGLG
ncbi:ABC transporter ATP-binding protein [Streptomyces liangshanensis]|uniref:ABC transporter ATP-binding protein n=1 Tax=Streptomyces liangshanensis TaxID=2717324 RepID=A0A6G9GSQ9_9ACTN|nr:ABC transporter ATP-binding protein [Streptomyces liangshanensis]QIQ01051.1 ABC transporter ATP-binding protein [Streptomyces liangshanensis]